MGWNTLNKTSGSLFNQDIENQYVYFVHSYYAEIGDHTTAFTDYIVPFSSSLHKENFYATQFHPEKSGKVGYEVLNNFIAI